MGEQRPARWRWWAYRAFWQVVDWLFPPACVGCGTWGAWFCEDCMARVPWLRPPWCALCGQPLPGAETTTQGETGLCARCRRQPLPLTRARAVAAMEGVVREAIHRLKYDGQVSLAFPLADWLAQTVRREGWSVEGVLPVPLGVQRRRERGYNQAALLAYPLAVQLGVPYLEGVVRRVRETRSQVGLSVEERWSNVRGAFAVVGALPVRRVLVVDDVMTTGATLAAVAQALRQGGAEAVWGLAVARAVLQQGDGAGGESVPGVGALALDTAASGEIRP